MEEYKSLSDAGLSEEVLNKIQQQVNFYGNQAEGLDDGDAVPVVVNDEIHLASYQSEGEASQFPDCPALHCSNHHVPGLREYCREVGPGHKALVCSFETGECCYCVC